VVQSAKAKDVARAASSACACNNLRKASRAITQVFDDALRPIGLRVTQFGILGTTMSLEPVTVTRLADELVTDRTTLTRNLNLLEKRGFIEIQPGEDRREKLVTLTPAGRDALASGHPHWKLAQQRVVDGLGPQQWTTLRDALAAVIDLVHRK
jgi:DNA-binding MarR family transcriptional regulator